MSNRGESPLIVGFIADLMFAVKIEDVARRLNYRVTWIERAGWFAPANNDTTLADDVLPAVQDAPPGRAAPEDESVEDLSSPGTSLLDSLTLWQPALILFDLGNHDIPWRKWIPWLKSVPETRRIPVLCFGSHMDVESMKAARSAGADRVLARSRFVADLPDLIQRYARIPDYAGIDAGCQGSLSDLAIKGLEEFNQGHYFEAHEYLEEAWNEDPSPARELYRAVLQVAVAYLQIERHNYNGALKMFLRLRQWIDPLPEECRGIDIAQLRSDAAAVRVQLLALGRERISELDCNLMRPVRYRRKP